VALWNLFANRNAKQQQEQHALKPIMMFSSHNCLIRSIVWRSDNPHIILCVGDDPNFRFWDIREPFEGSIIPFSGNGDLSLSLPFSLFFCPFVTSFPDRFSLQDCATPLFG